MKLVNFDTSVVSPSGDRLEFQAPEESPDGMGRCWLVCHNENHDPFDYRP
jgi:hypothetical protein